MKPTYCSITNNTDQNFTARIRFDSEDLKNYLSGTTDEFLWVEDADGNRIPIRVELLRESLAEKAV
jgi:hypothetical protein